MMTHLAYIVRHPNGPRLYLAGQRVHHGATGCALAVALLRWPTTRRAGIFVGTVLAIHDRHDWRIWWKRERIPVPAGASVAHIMDTLTDLYTSDALEASRNAV